tara:strand:+ start:232 stop:714 length:483 start_codon:yes stop_codon:yes gene_type:complete
MASKILTLNINGSLLPMPVAGPDLSVVNISATGQAANATSAGTVVISFSNNFKYTLSTGASAGNSFSVAAQANVTKAFWDAIIAAMATPWQEVVYPKGGGAWDQTYLPPAGVAVVAPDGPAGSPVAASNPTFAAKQSQPILDQAGTPGAVLFVSAVYAAI